MSFNRKYISLHTVRVLDNLRFMGSLLNPDILGIYLRGAGKAGNHEQHLEAAVRWICRAQDASADRGVARSYCLAYNRTFGRRGWIPSYPETTGYIIPTMFDYAHLTGRQEFFDRAVAMTDWESVVQMADGAVQGGVIGFGPTPSIFNTGQVIFGWVRAFKETGKEMYLDCARRAGRYLIERQDPDGAWRGNLSSYASQSMTQYTYNTRTAWALSVLAMLDGDRVLRDAAVRNVDFALNQQQENGYIRENCLTDPSKALLHTIAYCLRGILEIGIALDIREYIERCRIAIDRLLERMNPDGSFPGRFYPNWEPAVTWSCPTANSQVAVILGRLHQVVGSQGYLKGLKRINEFQMGVQILHTGNPDLHGGIAGSYPIHGAYGKFEILSWAVKFFIDAIMLEMEIGRAKKSVDKNEAVLGVAKWKHDQPTPHTKGAAP